MKHPNVHVCFLQVRADAKRKDDHHLTPGFSFAIFLALKVAVYDSKANNNKKMLESRPSLYTIKYIETPCEALPARLSVRSCLLITLIKCLKGQKSLGSLCSVVNSMIVSGARRTDRQ